MKFLSFVGIAVSTFFLGNSQCPTTEFCTTCSAPNVCSVYNDAKCLLMGATFKTNVAGTACFNCANAGC